MAIITWGAILLCLSQSALLSGLTLGFFGLSRLRLEILAEAQDKNALRILSLRKNANLLLSTLLWANVSVNVLFTLLTDSVVSGVAAFLISTVGITVFAEIIPQAYFNRHALRAGAFLVPLVKTYQFFLYPIAKPSSKLLDLWLGKEGPLLFLSCLLYTSRGRQINPNTGIAGIQRGDRFIKTMCRGSELN